MQKIKSMFEKNANKFQEIENEKQSTAQLDQSLQQNAKKEREMRHQMMEEATKVA